MMNTVNVTGNLTNLYPVQSYRKHITCGFDHTIHTVALTRYNTETPADVYCAYHSIIVP